MRLVVFGLTVSSSWGNGHATLWRGLIRALTAAGHAVTFFERDVPYYAEHRDLTALPEGAELVLYERFADVLPHAARALSRSDAAIVTSYCPDAIAATRLLDDTPRIVRCFYDLDSGVTLARLAAGDPVDYIGPDALEPFDVVFSYTGGPALAALRDRLRARRVLPLYGWVDETAYYPAPPRQDVSGLLTYLGTYAADRQAALEALFVEPARRRPEARFVIGGALYPDAFPWSDNIWFVRHVPPADHPAFYALRAAHAERDAGRDGAARLVPVRPAVRGGGLRRADPERLLGWHRDVLHARRGDPARRLHPRRAGRARP